MGDRRSKAGILIVVAVGLQAGFAQIPAAKPEAKRELQYAIVLTRHGVRAPTWEAGRLNQYAAQAWPSWDAPPGNLTRHGYGLMKIMGAYYRELFSSQGLLGKPACGDAARTYYWADNDQRTLETARALAETMLQGCKAVIHSLPEGKTDPLFDPIEAGAVHPDEATALAAVKGRMGPRPEVLVEAWRPSFDALTGLLNGNSKAKTSIFEQPVALKTGDGTVTMSGPLSLASTLSEDLLLEYANGMSGDELGWGRLNQANLLQVMALHTAYADLMRRTPYLARARGSNLLSHILRSLERAAAGKPMAGAMGTAGSSVVVISGHDTNLSNISGAMGLSWVLPTYQPDDAPPGGALIFSLWREAGTAKYSVRLQFVAQTVDQMHDATPLSLAEPPAVADVFVPGCARMECSWAEFQKAARAAIDAAFVR